MVSEAPMVVRWPYLSLAHNVSPLLGLKGYTATRYIARSISSYDVLVSFQCAELLSA